MELELIRTYFPEGTNGEILLNGKRLCSSIELPWLDNRKLVSCIPEGRYELIIRFSHRFQWHLQLKDVKERGLVLIHPANDCTKGIERLYRSGFCFRIAWQRCDVEDCFFKFIDVGF